MVQSVKEVIILSGLLLAQGNMFYVPLIQHQNRAQLFLVRTMTQIMQKSVVLDLFLFQIVSMQIELWVDPRGGQS